MSLQNSLEKLKAAIRQQNTNLGNPCPQDTSCYETVLTGSGNSSICMHKQTFYRKDANGECKEIPSSVMVSKTQCNPYQTPVC